MKGRLSLALCVPLLAAPAAADWAEVRAIFEARCTKCHQGNHAPLGPSLVSHAAVMSGSWTGPVVFPDTPEESPLYGRITGALQPRMPLDGPPFLDDTEIATLRA